MNNEVCYRSTPKIVGAFFDTIYQNPTPLLLMIAAISALAGWWYMTQRNAK